jgi:hypothetical protein
MRNLDGIHPSGLPIWNVINRVHPHLIQSRNHFGFFEHHELIIELLDIHAREHNIWLQDGSRSLNEFRHEAKMRLLSHLKTMLTSSCKL